MSTPQAQTPLRVAVVGGTAGIGRAIARAVAAQGHRVVVVGRTFRDPSTPNLEFLAADVSTMREARRVAGELRPETLDVLVFTQGITPKPTREDTAEGVERDMAVSYLSRLVMLRAMAPTLGSARAPGSPQPRVYVMGYPGQGQKGTNVQDLNFESTKYKPFEIHLNTVAGNEMLVLDGAKRYANLAVYGLNPGVIKTEIRGNYMGEDSILFRVTEFFIGLFTPTPETYAERIVRVILSPEASGPSGQMFDQRARVTAPSRALLDDPDHVRAFLDASDKLVQAKSPA